MKERIIEIRKKTSRTPPPVKRLYTLEVFLEAFSLYPKEARRSTSSYQERKKSSRRHIQMSKTKE